MSEIVGTAFDTVRPTQNYVCKQEVEKYVHRISAGEQVGHVEVYKTGGHYYIQEGHHRFVAYMRLGFEIQDIVFDGGKAGPVGYPDWTSVSYTEYSVQWLIENDHDKYLALSSQSAQAANQKKVISFINAVISWQHVGGDDGEVWGAAAELTDAEFESMSKFSELATENGAVDLTQNQIVKEKVQEVLAAYTENYRFNFLE
ncbi:hypothetical protein [Streptomyces sp. NPDC085932]|uniref:hypothetical protein n=1 Tax=Streptomyces sp. NPDC085932 TaxID=3365741 RepID=UPI0037D22053